MTRPDDVRYSIFFTSPKQEKKIYFLVVHPAIALIPGTAATPG